MRSSLNAIRSKPEMWNRKQLFVEAPAVRANPLHTRWHTFWRSLFKMLVFGACEQQLPSAFPIAVFLLWGAPTGVALSVSSVGPLMLLTVVVDLYLWIWSSAFHPTSVVKNDLGHRRCTHWHSAYGERSTRDSRNVHCVCDLLSLSFALGSPRGLYAEICCS